MLAPPGAGCPFCKAKSHEKPPPGNPLGTSDWELQPGCVLSASFLEEQGWRSFRLELLTLDALVTARGGCPC